EAQTWYGELSPPERRTFWACFSGWALDAMDVQIYSFVIPSLITAWSISKADAGALATAALLLSSIGGWVAGLLADRIGRVRTLQITILWFAFFTGLSGLAQNFEQLFATRALMGLGFGGEWAAGSVLMGEVIRARHRGKAVGTVQSGWAVGWGAAVILQAILFSTLPDQIAWRALFFCGIAPAFLVFFVRKHVPEPAVFEATRAAMQAKGGVRPSLWAIFSPRWLKTTLLCSLLATGAQGGYYAITTWLPSYLKTEKHLSVLNSSGYLAVIIVGSFTGYVVGAYLTDRIGRRNNAFLFSVCSTLTVLVYAFVPIDNATMLVLGFPLGFFASGVFSGIGAFFTELFPTALRGSGQGFAYNFGRAVGALFPWLVGVLSATMNLGEAIGLFAAGAYGLMFLAALLLPETKGRELTEDA
ncbi:MAG: major facilitator superfamily 1, partial [Rhodospirillales bacterium]|nr:major facilitator superfamily 1 [Rhodospirillales bacterium]